MNVVREIDDGTEIYEEDGVEWLRLVRANVTPPIAVRG